VCVCVCVCRSKWRGEGKKEAETWRGGLALKWNNSVTGANMEGRPKASCDGLELAERFGSKIFKISRV
jgi:hypothetical protein